MAWARRSVFPAYWLSHAPQHATHQHKDSVTLALLQRVPQYSTRLRQSVCAHLAIKSRRHRETFLQDHRRHQNRKEQHCLLVGGIIRRHSTSKWCCCLSASASVSDSPWSDVVPVLIQAPLLDHVQQRHRKLGRRRWGHPRGALHVHTGLQQAAAHQPIDKSIIVRQATNADIFSSDVEPGHEEQVPTMLQPVESPCGRQKVF